MSDPVSLSSGTEPPRVFISYSHDSREHQDIVRKLADRLRADGVDANIDQYESTPAEGWPLWMEKEIQSSDFVLLICTEAYYLRVMKEGSGKQGLGVCWEAHLIYQHLYEHRTKNDRFLPIVLTDMSVEWIPTPLRGTTRFVLSQSNGYESLYRTLTRQPDVLKPILGQLRALPPKHLTSESRLPIPVPTTDSHADVIMGPLNPEVMDISALSANFPSQPHRELQRDHIVHTIQTILARDIDVVTIEGEDGIGKTILSAQFARSFTNRVFSIFIRADSRLSYDPETIRINLADQLYWGVNGERIANNALPAVKLTYLYSELQRRARRKRLIYYFVVDGLSDIPQYNSAAIPNILQLLPLGLEGFKFVLTGDLRLYSTHLHSLLSTKPFPLVEFGLDETLKYFEDMSIERSLVVDLHKVCRGVPGRLADVRRCVESGTTVMTCLANLSEHQPQLFSLEWQQVDSRSELLSKTLAILAHDDKVHTITSLALLVGSNESSVRSMLANLTFLIVSPDREEICFVSEEFRKYAAEQLRRLENWVHKVNIKQLLTRPDSDDALLELPLHLTEASEFQALLQYLTPQHILAMLRRTQSLSRVQATVDAGLASAKRLERDGDMLRFAIEESLLREFLASGVGVTEAEALVSLKDYTSALSLANAALLREDRLHILAVIGKGKRRDGYIVEAELMDQIRVLLRQIDVKSLGQRAIEIASQLICVDPELALDLIDQAKPSEMERDRAFTRLSLLTLETLGAEASLSALDTMKARGSSAKLDILQKSLSLVSKQWSGTELIAHLERIDKTKDKLFLVQSWLEVSQHENHLADVIKYAMDLSIRATDYPINATVLRKIADPLYKEQVSSRLPELVGMFQAQMGGAAKLGPSVEFARLQIALARCEARYDQQACENRLITAFYEIAQIEDIVTRTEAWAWLLDGISEIETILPYSVQFTVGKDVALELESTFITLLDATADHYRAASGVIEALCKAHIDKAFEFISMLNTETRRDKALLDIIFSICTGTKPELRVEALKDTMLKIKEPHMKDAALGAIIERFYELESEDILNCQELPQLLTGALEMASASMRCETCARSYILVQRLEGRNRDELGERFLQEVTQSWSNIDIGWLRVKTGFEVAEILAKHPELSAKQLAETERYRATLGGLASRDAHLAYLYSVRLVIRAFAGLVPRRVHTKQDLDLLGVFIASLPSAGERAILWSEVALRCAIHGHSELCADIVNEKVRPLVAQLSGRDKEYHERVLSQVAPALFQVNSSSTLGTLDALSVFYRDTAYGNIVDYLFRNESPDEPEEYVPGTGYNVSYSRLLKVCDVIAAIDSDDQIYSAVERVVDCITSKKLTVAYTINQKEDLVRRLEIIIETKLPASRCIRHEGYKVIARAQLARFRPEQDVSGLVAEAERIPNLADRCLVMFDTALAISKGARTTSEKLLKDSRDLVSRIPSHWDKFQRLVGFAYEAKPGNPGLSRQMLEEAIRILPKKEEGRKSSLRRIVDLAYRIDSTFANELVDKLDDDKARQDAQGQIRLLELKQKMVDESPAYDELQGASRAECIRLGSMVLGSLHSDRMDTIRPQAIRPCVQAMAHQPMSQVYAVLAWIVQNSVERHSSTDKAAFYLRPVFEATLAGAQLAGELANRSFEELRAAQQRFGERPSRRSKAVEAFDREQAIRVIKSWLENNAKSSIIVCDPVFSPEDLLVVQLIRGINSSCRVDIVTGRPSSMPSDGSSWEDFYVSQWNDMSEQSPPPTRITMISPVVGECPIKICCLLAADSGLELSDSIHSLGMERAPTFSKMETNEVEALRESVHSVLSGGNEWGGIRVRFSSFSRS